MRYAAVLILALVTAAAADASQSATVAPAAGSWKLHNIETTPEVKNGSFTVTSKGYVTGFSLTLGPGAETPCGGGALAVKVLGQQKLVADPLNDLGGPTNEYAVSSPTNVITPVPVKVTVEGKQQAGQLELAFGPGARGGKRTGGEISYSGGNCEVAFGFTKA